MNEFNHLINEFQQVGIEAKFDGKVVSLSYDRDKSAIVEKLLFDFYDRKNLDLRLLNDNGNCNMMINWNQPTLPQGMLFQELSRSLASYDSKIDYQEKMRSELKNFYELFERSFNYEGRFGIGVQNFYDHKSYRIRTNMDEMLEVLRNAGFVVEGGKVTFPSNGMISIDDAFANAIRGLDNLDKSMEDDKAKEENKLAPGESKVDIYEKVVKNEAGKDVLVRMSIVNQNIENNPDRLVTVSYIDPDTGVATINNAFEYEDGYKFDKYVLPEIIDGFSKNVQLSGRDVHVDSTDSTKLYSGGSDEGVILEGAVDSDKSIVAADKENNLFGDEDNQVNLWKLEQDDVIDYKNTPGTTLEEQVTDNTMNDDVQQQEQENSEYVIEESGPKLVRKLGEMPGPNNFGLANHMSLIFFLAVDIAAIVVGIYLLMS